MDNDNVILIGTSNNDIYLKPLGHITAALCFPLREMIFKNISSFNSHFNIYVDLSETRYMDSTFLGLMVGIDKKIQKELETHLIVLNPNPISQKLMRSMGLNRFLQTKEEELPSDLVFVHFDNDLQIDELEKSKIVLKSHKDLMMLSEENKKRFSTLTDVLEDQIKDRDSKTR